MSHLRNRWRECLQTWLCWYSASGVWGQYVSDWTRTCDTFSSITDYIYLLLNSFKVFTSLVIIPRQLNNHSHLDSPRHNNPHEGWLDKWPTRVLNGSVAVSQFRGCIFRRTLWRDLRRLCQPFLVPSPDVPAITMMPLSWFLWQSMPFSFFLSSFLPSFKESWDMGGIIAMRPSKTGKRRPHLWAAFEGAFELGQPNVVA